MMLDGKKVYFQYGYHSILCFYSCKIKAIVFFDEYSRFEMVDKSWVKNKMDVHKSNGQCADERASSAPSFPSGFVIPLHSHSTIRSCPCCPQTRKVFKVVFKQKTPYIDLKKSDSYIVKKTLGFGIMTLHVGI